MAAETNYYSRQTTINYKIFYHNLLAIIGVCIQTKRKYFLHVGLLMYRTALIMLLCVVAYLKYLMKII